MKKLELRLPVFISIMLIGMLFIPVYYIYRELIIEFVNSVWLNISTYYVVYIYAIVAISIASTIVLSVHESGHMFTAKKCDMRVLEYSIGMGPCLWSKILNGTRYSFRLILFGGYVKIGGFLGGDTYGDDRDFDRRPKLQSIAVMMAGVLVNFLMFFVLFTYLYYNGTTEVSMVNLGTTISYVDSGSQEQMSGLEIGDKIISVNEKYVYDWDDVQIAYLTTSSNTIHLLVERGVVEKEISVPVVRDNIGNVVINMLPRVPMYISKVTPGSSADMSGFKKYDEIEDDGQGKHIGHQRSCGTDAKFDNQKHGTYTGKQFQAQ